MMTTDDSGCNKGYSNKNLPTSNNDFEYIYKYTNAFSGLKTLRIPLIDAPKDLLISAKNAGYTIGYTIAQTITPDKAHDENKNCDYTSKFNGTSSAAPSISGIIALLLQANSDLTWRDVKYVLANSAIKVDEKATAPYAKYTKNSAGYEHSNWYGFGKPDAKKAVKIAKLINTNSLGNYVESKIKINANINKRLFYTMDDTINIGIQKVKHIENVAVVVDIDTSIHSLDKLEVSLISPSGTKSILLTPSSNFDALSRGLKEYTLMSNAFYGEESLGKWKLQIRDIEPTNSILSRAILNKWGIVFYGGNKKILKLSNML